MGVLGTSHSEYGQSCGHLYGRKPLGQLGKKYATARSLLVINLVLLLL